MFIETENLIYAELEKVWRNGLAHTVLEHKLANSEDNLATFILKI